MLQMFDSLLNKGFRGDRCKTLLKLVTSRIKLLRNKRLAQLKQARKELAQLLQSGQESSARIRVEHIIREQNIMAAYDILELYCELVIVRIPIIELQRECPLDLQEAVASLIFAAPRSSDLTELLQVRNMFAIKYGKEFVAAATELLPGCKVNRTIIEKLSARAPSAEAKINVMREIAEEHHIDWDAESVEFDLTKVPEDLLDGPTHFVSPDYLSEAPPSEDDSSSLPTPVDPQVGSSPYVMEDTNIKDPLQKENPSPPLTKSVIGSQMQSEEAIDPQVGSSPHVMQDTNIKDPLQKGNPSPPLTKGVRGSQVQSEEAIHPQGGSSPQVMEDRNIKDPLQKENPLPPLMKRVLGSQAQSGDAKFIPFVTPVKVDAANIPARFYSPPRESTVVQSSGLSEEALLQRLHSRTKSEGSMDLQAIVEAAEAAAESAEQAAKACRVAAEMARSKLSPKSSPRKDDDFSFSSAEISNKEKVSEMKPNPSYNAESDGINHLPADSYDWTQQQHKANEFTGNALNDNYDWTQHGDQQGRDHRKDESYEDKAYDDHYDWTGHLNKQVQEHTDQEFYNIPKSTIAAEHGRGKSGEGKTLTSTALAKNDEEDAAVYPQTIDSSRRLPSLDDDSYYTYPNLFTKS